jgi:hypothetical protein
MQNNLEGKTPELLLEKYSYNIGGKEFILHHDYSWDEGEWLQEFLRKFNNTGNIYKSENISKTEATTFLKTVLKYKDGSNPVDFNFGSATKTETSQVITDFFLTYMLLQISMQQFLKLSEEEREKLLMTLMT